MAFPVPSSSKIRGIAPALATASQPSSLFWARLASASAARICASKRWLTFNKLTRGGTAPDEIMSFCAPTHCEMLARPAAACSAAEASPLRSRAAMEVTPPASTTFCWYSVRPRAILASAPHASRWPFALPSLSSATSGLMPPACAIMTQ